MEQDYTVEFEMRYQREYQALIKELSSEQKMQLEHVIALTKQREGIDPLTGLFSRKIFISEAERRLSTARRYAQPFVYFALDIDHFKRVNDEVGYQQKRGHAAGDLLLRDVGIKVIQKSLRAGDLAGRVGGEEFGVVLYNAGDKT